ncbi:MAG: hypothetical protein IT256_09260 [Chitinophagaceae bacterium]|nr:hypothetical protein [Chitinophagaceae bacterium]
MPHHGHLGLRTKAAHEGDILIVGFNNCKI